MRSTSSTLIEDGYLSDVRAKRVRYNADFSQLKVTGGDISEGSAAKVFREGGGPAAVAKALGEYAPDRKSLVFVPGVESAYETAATIDQAGIAAAAIDGTTPLMERRDTLHRFHTGEVRALVNCGVLTEGYDEPSVDCVLLARPTKSRALYAQMVGRGARRFPGKDDVLVLDLAGNTSRHDLVSPASLLGLDPADLRDGELITEAIGRTRRRVQRVAEAQQATVALHARDVALFKNRPVHWVAGGSRYTISTGHSIISLRADDAAADRWSAIERLHDGTTHVIAGGLSLEYAQGAAEDYVRRTGVSILVDPNAAWRRSALPPSDKQLAVLRRNRITIPPNLTRGEASDLITQVLARRAS